MSHQEISTCNSPVALPPLCHNSLVLTQNQSQYFLYHSSIFKGVAYWFLIQVLIVWSFENAKRWHYIKWFFAYHKFSIVCNVPRNRRPLQRGICLSTPCWCLFFCLINAARDGPDVLCATTSMLCTVTPLGSGSVGRRAIFILRTDPESVTWLPLPL